MINMLNYNSNLQSNNTDLQSILDTINNLPEAGGGGTELPALTNEGSASDLLEGKELIDGEGNIVEGTMPMGSAKTPATTITKTPSITVSSSGLITASISGTQNITPMVSAGYISSGTSGTITVSGSATKQLTTQAAKTITPSTSSQTAVASGRYTTGTITVSPIPSEYIIPFGELAITSNGTYDITEYASANVNITNGSEDLTTELNTQETKLNQLLSILDTKASGGSSNPTASPKDVNFYDYDGTILYSYTIEEAQALTELPPLPSQSGLICQGWNYDLTTIQSYNRAVNVGATYITDDGKTRLYIRIAAEGRMTVPLYFSQTVANGVTIDWGDGSATETLSGTGNKNTSHTYSSIGDYVITLEATNGTLGLGNGSSSYCVMGPTGNNGLVYCNMLQKAEIGNNATRINSGAFYNCYSLASVTIPEGVTSIGSHAFYNCSSLTSIMIPEGVTSLYDYAFNGCHSLASVTLHNSVTSIGSDAFNGCYSLASVTIPEGVTSIGSHAFSSCHSLASVTIPEGVTSISSYAFRNCSSLTSIMIPDSVTSINSGAFNDCHSLASVTIPEGVTSISGYAFYNCYSLASVTIPNSVTSIYYCAFYNCSGMAFYDFTACTAVPTLSDIGAFENIPSDCIIKVPSALYDEWIVATNWSTYASQIVAV